jgi:predicted NBD/HSP70 family sugar kinase
MIGELNANATRKGRYYWGFDLGGTKIEGAILDPVHPEKALHRLRLPTESSEGYDHILGQFSKLISQLEQASGIKRPSVVGVGTPGVIVPSTGLLRNSNTLCLNNRPLAQDLTVTLGCDVIVANDANCCALAEATLGAAKGYHTVFGIILGTGVGGGIAIDGKILTGAHGICGEWGHNPIPGEITPCYCGRAGCVETVISGPALERFYREQSCDELLSHLRLPAIAELAGKGDPAAMATLERLREKFAMALGAVINILDPDAIVIGGGVGNLDLLYHEETRAAILRHLFNNQFTTPILRPALGDSAGVFGAAMLTKK